jgi:hypothetical protein
MASSTFTPSAVNSLTDGDAVYDFFVDAGFTSIAFNLDEAEGANTQSSLTPEDFCHTRNAYQCFFRLHRRA